MTVKDQQKEKRTGDPYLDRRSGEDQREGYSIDYFSKNGPERRKEKDRRKKIERREGCIQVSKWSSICVDEVKKG